MSRKRRSDRDKSRMLLIGASLASCLLMLAAVVPMAVSALLPEASVAPSDTELASYLGSAQWRLKRGLGDAAMGFVDDALRGHRNSPHALVCRSWALNLRGGPRDYEDAAEAAEEVLKYDRKCVPALNNKAEARLHQAIREANESERERLLKEAQDCADGAIDANANCVASWIIKGNILTERGEDDWADANTAYDRALDLDPNSVQALVAKGWLANRRGDYGAALRCHKAAVAALEAAEDPDCPKAWRIEAYRIGIYAEMGNDANAAPTGIILRAIDTYKDSAELYNDKGLALYRQGKYAEAYEALREATKLDQGCYRAWNNLALAQAAQGHREDAIASLDKALKIKSGYAPALHNKALLTGADPAATGKTPPTPTASPAAKAHRP